MEKLETRNFRRKVHVVRPRQRRRVLTCGDVVCPREQRILKYMWIFHVRCALAPSLIIHVSIARPFGGRLGIKPIPSLCPYRNEVDGNCFSRALVGFINH